jgi:hypothetical protein
MPTGTLERGSRRSLEREADLLAVVVVDAVLGEHGALGVAADVAEAGRGIEEAGSDVGVPGEVVELLEQPVEGGVLLQEGRAGREAELAVPVGGAEGRDDVVAPHS